MSAAVTTTVTATVASAITAAFSFGVSSIGMSAASQCRQKVSETAKPAVRPKAPIFRPIDIVRLRLNSDATFADCHTAKSWRATSLMVSNV